MPTYYWCAIEPLKRPPGWVQCSPMHSPIDAVNELISRHHLAQQGEDQILLFLTESLVEIQYVLKSKEYDAEKLATIEVHVRDMLRRIAHAAET